MHSIHDAGTRIRARYADIAKQRSKTKLMTLVECNQLMQQHVIVANTPITKSSVTGTSTSTSTSTSKKANTDIPKTHCCKAIKMDGMPCTVKIIESALYCKRHSKPYNK